MNDFIRAFQLRKKTFLPDAILLVVSSFVLNATNSILPLVVVGAVLVFKMVVLWIGRKKFSQKA